MTVSRATTPPPVLHPYVYVNSEPEVERATTPPPDLDRGGYFSDEDEEDEAQGLIVEGLQYITQMDLSDRVSLLEVSNWIYWGAREDWHLSSTSFSLGEKVQKATYMFFTKKLTKFQYRDFIVEILDVVEKDRGCLPSLDCEIERFCKEGENVDLLEAFAIAPLTDRQSLMIRKAVQMRIRERFDVHDWLFTFAEFEHIFAFLNDFPFLTDDCFNTILRRLLPKVNTGYMQRFLMRFQVVVTNRPQSSRYVHNGLEKALSLPAFYECPVFVREFFVECAQGKWKFVDETPVTIVFNRWKDKLT